MLVDLKNVTEKDFGSFCDIQVIDCHTHVWSVDEIFRIAENEKRYRVDKINVLALTAYDEEYMANNLMCLLLKLLHPGSVYAFGSLQYPLTRDPKDGTELLEQAERLMKLGFDGMKMIEGKPSTRKRTGIPLDSPVYDRYYGYLETHGIPLLYHVNDPAVNWDRGRVSQFTIDQGWAYLDDSFQTKEGLYNEVEGILKKFPGLRVIFAHFYFMDEEGVTRASEFLDRWPEVSFDLAPGWMFKNFEQNHAQWREFFIKYQDRLLFGTDNDYGLSKELIYTMRTILETDNEIEFWDTRLRGMHFDRDILEKLYANNFQRYAGTAQKKVDPGLVAEECGRIAARALNSPLKDRVLKDIQAVSARLEQELNKKPAE